MIRTVNTNLTSNKKKFVKIKKLLDKQRNIEQSLSWIRRRGRRWFWGCFCRWSQSFSRYKEIASSQVHGCDFYLGNFSNFDRRWGDCLFTTQMRKKEGASSNLLFNKSLLSPIFLKNLTKSFWKTCFSAEYTDLSFSERLCFLLKICLCVNFFFS